MEQRLQQPEEINPITPTLNTRVPQQSLTDEATKNMESASVAVEPVENIQAVLSREAQQFRRHTWRAVIAFELFSLMAAWLFKRYTDTTISSPVFVIGFVSVLFLLSL